MTDIRGEILGSLSRQGGTWMVSSPGRLNRLVPEYGAKLVREEIDDMINSDLADRAQIAAENLGFKDLADLAARVVENSGGYR